tara:strand:- start:1684 stop:2223 length:540 start_codon:yes stop_codon:yes gene_type:complete
MHGKLVGLGCRAQVGKDTAAAGLGFRRLAFADSVRALAGRIDPYVNDFGLRLSDAVERLGWDGAKVEVDEVRRLLQELGGGARELIGTDIWVHPVMVYAQDLMLIGESVVITDVRYPNEADAIQSAGGTLIRIDRPDVPRLDHPTENALDDYDFDHVIDNSGSVEELCDAVRAIVGSGS